MKRILLVLALVLIFVAFSADSCTEQLSPSVKWHCLYRVDYTSTTFQEDIGDNTPPNQLTLGSTTTHLVKGSCTKA
jgi:hypothetical protein